MFRRMIDRPKPPSDHARMSRLLRTLLSLLLLLTLGSFPLHAQDSPQEKTATPAQTLTELNSQLTAVSSTLKNKNSDIKLSQLRSTAMGVQDQAQKLAASLAPQMSDLQAKLDVLGPAPAAGAPAEAPEVSSKRHQLDRSSAALDAQIKQAQLLAQNATQLATQITGQRNDQFQAQLTSRTATPLSAEFWVGNAHTFPDDVSRLGRLNKRVGDALQESWQPPNRTPLLLCLSAAILLVGVGRWLLEKLLLWLTTRRVPDGHLRRSAMATAVALLSVLTTGLAAQLLYLGINWNDILDPELDRLATVLVNLVLFAAYINGLGRALLSVQRPSWRLIPLADAAAQCLRPFPWLLGATALLLGLIERINRTIGSSLFSTVVSRGLIALVISSLFGIALWRLARVRRAMVVAGIEPHPRPLWLGLLVAGAWVSIVISGLGVLTGYISLAFFIAGQMLWVGLVVASVYLLSELLQDIFSTVLSPRGRNGKRLQHAFKLDPNTLDQAVVILSGTTRTLLVLLALTLVLLLYGAGPHDLIAGTLRTLGGFKLGELPIDPGSIFSGVLVFMIGLFALDRFKRWLSDQLLPKTSMDVGMRTSIVTLLGYVGVMLIMVLTLAALHVDLKSITWIISALSLGIGFGMQAIVSNFISGLILLAERPVKVGDWISLAGVEGDVQKINVRATEIQLWDRSTMIVPNSQLITQNVRNVTWGYATGRVKFTLPLPLDTDAGRVRDIILARLAEHPSTLDDPEPYVRLADVDAVAMTFAAYAFTRDPRDIFQVKSELLFSVLERLRAEKIRMIRPQDMRLHNPPPQDDGTSNMPYD